MLRSIWEKSTKNSWLLTAVEYGQNGVVIGTLSQLWLLKAQLPINSCHAYRFLTDCYTVEDKIYLCTSLGTNPELIQNSNMNIYSVKVLAAISTATAAEISNFMGFVSPLFITSQNHTVWHDNGEILMQFETDHRFTVPADATGIIEYSTVALDTRATKILTTLDKPTLYRGDICFVLSTNNHDNEIEDNIQINLVSGEVLIIGQGAASQTEFYDPFTSPAAIATRIFDRVKTAKLQAELEFESMIEEDATAKRTVAVMNNNNNG